MTIDLKDPPDLRTCIIQALQEAAEEDSGLSTEATADRVLDAIAIHELDKASLMMMLKRESDDLIRNGEALQKFEGQEVNMEARARIMAGSAIGDVVQIMWIERRSRAIREQMQNIKDRVERILSEKVKEEEP